MLTARAGTREPRGVSTHQCFPPLAPPPPPPRRLVCLLRFTSSDQLSISPKAPNRVRRSLAGALSSSEKRKMKTLYLRSSGRFKKLLLSIGHRGAKNGNVVFDAKDKETPAAAPSPESPRKPAWRCFSYDEIHRATNGFHKGASHQLQDALGCQRRIIHRDINASNVLLTDDFQPQISDFGLAKWLPSEWTHRAIAPIEGTFGCLAPEYYTHGIVDEKTDVFAFGVFLLEIMTGRKPVDGSHKSLLSWARPFLNEGRIEALVDPRIGRCYDGEQARRLAFVASLCIRASATWRPSMTEVLELLDGVEIRQDWWAMPEAEDDDDEELWGFDDLDDDDVGDGEDFNTPSPSSSSTLST
ncbi:hypothetical protein ABZP36_010395 [Zizania latifolia]